MSHRLRWILLGVLVPGAAWVGPMGCSNPPAVLQAAFTATPASGAGPLVVQFTDASTPGADASPIVSWLWDFGDPPSGSENTSTEPNPSHTYRLAGSYSVSLTVGTATGTATTTRVDVVAVTHVGPTADFTATPTAGAPGTLVRFTSTSNLGSGSSPTYLWDFGDPASGPANSSNLVQPTHRYQAAGTYTVSLSVGTSAGSATVTKEDLITIEVPPQPPVADFEAEATLAEPGQPVQFTDRSTSALPVTAWLWDFGDPDSGAANTSGAQHPAHSYSAPGVYAVTLTVSNADGSDTRVRDGYIVVVAAPDLAESVRALANPQASVSGAALLFVDQYFAAIGALGQEAADETVDVALSAALRTEADIGPLMRRFDQLVGFEVAAPAQLNPKHKAVNGEACNGTTVIHVNGMNVLFTEFVANVQALGSAVINDPQFAGEDVEVIGVYQRSATDAQFSVFGGVICPLVGNPAFPLVQARLQAICRSAGGALIDLAEAGQQKLRDWATFPDALDTAAQTLDRARITGPIVANVRDRARNVVVVCHSQGNFFTRDVVNALEGDVFGPYADSVAVVQVASPTSTMPAPTERIDICQDPVPQLSSEYSLATCHPWHRAPGGGADFASHDFIGAYLAAATGATARAAMLAQILAYHLELTNPRAQSDLAVEPATLDATPEAPEVPVALRILPPDFGDLAWSATTSDPRIDIEPASGVLRSGQSPPDENTLFVSVNDFTESFVGEVRIQNDCIPGELIAVQVRVPGPDLLSIHFDEVEGFGFLPIDGGHYADLGVLFDSDMNLIVLAGNDDAVTPPNGLCGGDGSNFCVGTVGITFDPPVDQVSFYVGDRELDRREFFQIEVLDPNGAPLDFVNSRIDRRFFTFAFSEIGRVVFHPSSDAELIDSLSFRRRP